MMQDLELLDMMYMRALAVYAQGMSLSMDWKSGLHPTGALIIVIPPAYETMHGAGNKGAY